MDGQFLADMAVVIQPHVCVLGRDHLQPPGHIRPRLVDSRDDGKRGDVRRAAGKGRHRRDVILAEPREPRPHIRPHQRLIGQPPLRAGFQGWRETIDGLRLPRNAKVRAARTTLRNVAQPQARGGPAHDRLDEQLGRPEHMAAVQARGKQVHILFPLRRARKGAKGHRARRVVPAVAPVDRRGEQQRPGIAI